MEKIQSSIGGMEVHAEDPNPAHFPILHTRAEIADNNTKVEEVLP